MSWLGLCLPSGSMWWSRKWKSHQAELQDESQGLWHCCGIPPTIWTWERNKCSCLTYYYFENFGDIWAYSKLISFPIITSWLVWIWAHAEWYRGFKSNSACMRSSLHWLALELFPMVRALPWSALRTDPHTVPLQGHSGWLLGRDILLYHISGPWYRIYYWFFSKKQRISKTSDFRKDGTNQSRPSLCHLPSEC